MIRAAIPVALALLLIAAPAAADYLWAVTETNLVVIDHEDPSEVTVVGPHGLVDPPSYLAYHVAEGRLFGLRSVVVQPSPLVLDYDLVEYDMCSGEATVRNLGLSSSGGVFEGLEYVDSLGSLVASWSDDNGFITSAFQTLDPDTGALGFLVDVGFDNDQAVHDDVRDIHYVWDPNNTFRFQIVDLGGGGVTDLAPAGANDGDGAFSEADGGIFIVEASTGSLRNIQTTNGLAPITRVDVGTVAGDPPRGIAFTPRPPPSCGCAPIEGCVPAGKASLTVVEKKPGREKLNLSLKKFVEETTKGSFGDPVASQSRYAVCIYDETATLVAGLAVDRAQDTCGSKGKPCWGSKADKGYAYKDPDAAASGAKKIVALSGDAGKGKLLVRAANNDKKSQTAMPVGIAAALENHGAAAVQVLVSEGRCYEASLDDVKKADGMRFKAKGTGGLAQ